MKENVGSGYCFLDIAERKARAKELCSSYNLLDVNTHTMLLSKPPGGSMLQEAFMRCRERNSLPKITPFPMKSP